MGRWQPGAGGRLQAAALELYAAQGFESTTVVQIAQRAGVTERTFFRYFRDKREVLFAGSDALREVLLQSLDAQPPNTPPLDLMAAALGAVAVLLTDRPWSRQRHAVIAATPELQERELSKMASWAAVLHDRLRARYTAEPAAGLAAEVGVAAFRIAWERWLEHDEDRTLLVHLDEGFDALLRLTCTDPATAFRSTVTAATPGAG